MENEVESTECFQQEEITKSETNLPSIELIPFEENKFYCEKCYDTVNYLIDECLTISPQLTELKKMCHMYKNSSSSFRSKYTTLEFNYQEEKTMREDLEERYNLLLKTITRKGQNVTPVPVQQANVSDQHAIVAKSSVIHITNLDEDLKNFQIQTNVNTHFFLDIDCLTKQISTETTLNLERIFQHFAQKSNEYMKANSAKLLVYKKKFASECETQRMNTQQTVKLTEKCSSLEKENWLKDNELKASKDENEQLKIQNKVLSDERDAFKLENELLKSSFDKASDSLQKWNMKYEQVENQVHELEKLNHELLEDLRKYSEINANKSMLLFFTTFIVQILDIFPI